MRGAVMSHDGYVLLREDRSTRAQNWASRRGAFTFRQEKNSKVHQYWYQWPQQKWKDADEDERARRDVLGTPSTRQTSCPGVRLHMYKLQFEELWLSSTTRSESSRIHVVSTHRRPSRAKRAASEKNPSWRRSTWTRAKCSRRPLCMTVMDGVPTKNSPLSIISYKKASQVFEEKELDKHSAVRSCQAGGSGEGEWSRRVAKHEACMGFHIHAGTRIHWDAHQTFFGTKVRGRGGVQAYSSGIRI